MAVCNIAVLTLGVILAASLLLTDAQPPTRRPGRIHGRSCSQREYYSRKYCKPSRKGPARCKTVFCPRYTSLEMSFFKTEAETRAIYERQGFRGQRATVRIVPPGSRISVNVKRTSTFRADAAQQIFYRQGGFGCKTHLAVDIGENGETIYVYDGVKDLELASIPEQCGGLVQGVIYAICGNDNGCCNIENTLCDILTVPVKYLVVDPASPTGTSVVEVETAVCCQCFNAQLNGA